MDNSEEEYDRNKGLVDSDLKPASHTRPDSNISLYLSGFDSDRRSVIVDQITSTVRKSGDLFQIISNDEYKSVEHRVIGSSSSSCEPRVSVGYFFNPGKREELYGPLPELVLQEKPALYRHFKLSEFMHRFLTKELDGKSLKEYYRL